MKRVFQIIGFFCVLGLFYLFTQAYNIQSVTRDIVINAPKDKVWAVISNINGWAESNSAVNAASGEAELGSVISITMRGEKVGEDGPSFAPVINDIKPMSHFRWVAKMGASIIFHNEKLLSLEDIDGGTRLTHTEYFSGMIVPLMLSWIDTGVPPILDEMNAGFKAAAEM